MSRSFSQNFSQDLSLKTKFEHRLFLLKTVFCGNRKWCSLKGSRETKEYYWDLESDQSGINGFFQHLSRIRECEFDKKIQLAKEDISRLEVDKSMIFQSLEVKEERNKKTIADLKVERAGREEDKEKYKAATALLKGECKKLNDKISILQASLDREEKQRSELELKCMNYERQCSDLGGRISQAGTKESKLLAKNACLKEEKNKQRKQYDENVDNLTSRLASITGAKKNLEREKKEQSVFLSKQKKELARLREEVEELQEKNKELRDKSSAYETFGTAFASFLAAIMGGGLYLAWQSL